MPVEYGDQEGEVSGQGCYPQNPTLLCTPASWQTQTEPSWAEWNAAVMGKLRAATSPPACKALQPLQEAHVSLNLQGGTECNDPHIASGFEVLNIIKGRKLTRRC